MELKDRLEVLMKAQGLTPYKFADEIGMVRESFYKITRGQTMNPGYEFFKSIKKRFPSVSYSWLIDGSGEMEDGEGYTHNQMGTDAMPSESAEGWKAYAEEKEKTIARLESYLADRNDDIAFLKEIIRKDQKSFLKPALNTHKGKVVLFVPQNVEELAIA